MGLDLHTQRPVSSTCNMLTIRRQYHQREELQTLVCIMNVLELTTITQVLMVEGHNTLHHMLHMAATDLGWSFLLLLLLLFLIQQHSIIIIYQQDKW
jgi:hypothetical protein